MSKLHKTISGLLCLFIFLLPWQTRWIYKNLYLNDAPWEYGSLSLYATEILLGLIILLSLIYFIGKLKVTPRLAAPKNKWRLAILGGLLVLVLLNGFFSANPELAFQKITWLILAAGLALLIIIFQSDWKKISWSFILAALWQSLMAINQFMNQKIVAHKWLGIATQDPQTLGTPIVEIADGRWLRTFGALPHPNMLAAFLLFSLFIIISLYATNIKKRLKKILTIIFVVNALALATTLSRAAFLSLVVTIVFLLIVHRRQKNLLKTLSRFILLLLIVFILFAVSYPQLLQPRIFSQGRVENISNEARLNQYAEFGKIYRSHWLMGAGISQYPETLRQALPTAPIWRIQPIHNLYLLIIGELGLLGIILVLVYFYWLFALLKKNNQTNPPTENTGPPLCLRSSLLASLTILALFDHPLWSFYFGIMLLSLVLSLALIKPRTDDEKL